MSKSIAIQGMFVCGGNYTLRRYVWRGQKWVSVAEAIATPQPGEIAEAQGTVIDGEIIAETEQRIGQFSPTVVNVFKLRRGRLRPISWEIHPGANCLYVRQWQRGRAVPLALPLPMEGG